MILCSAEISFTYVSFTYVGVTKIRRCRDVIFSANFILTFNRNVIVTQGLFDKRRGRYIEIITRRRYIELSRGIFFRIFRQ